MILSRIVFPTYYVCNNIMAGVARRAGNAHSSGAPDFTLGLPDVRDIRFTIDVTTLFCILILYRFTIEFTTDIVYFIHGLFITGLFDRRHFHFSLKGQHCHCIIVSPYEVSRYIGFSGVPRPRP